MVASGASLAFGKRSPEAQAAALAALRRQTAAPQPATSPTAESAIAATEVAKLLTALQQATPWEYGITDVPTAGTELWVARRSVTGAVITNYELLQIPMIEELSGPSLALSVIKARGTSRINEGTGSGDIIEDNVVTQGDLLDYGVVSGSLLYNPVLEAHSGLNGMMGLIKYGAPAAFVKFYRPITQSGIPGASEVPILPYLPPVIGVIETAFEAFVTKARFIDRIRQPKKLEFELTLINRPWIYEALTSNPEGEGGGGD